MNIYEKNSMTPLIDTLAGTVLRFEYASIHDGEGIRTVVFLKGCPLRCAWCSTPEGHSFAPEMVGDKLHGQELTVRQVMAKIEKDEVFFFHSGGGATISGGEPLCQPAFVEQILRGCRELAIGTALETSLYAEYAVIAPLLPWLDILYFDLKLFDSARHRQFIGIDNTQILDNIRRVAADESYSGSFILRRPIIPGINDDERDLRDTALFCRDLMRLDYIELLPYHRLGLETYRKMGKEYALADIKTPTGGQMERAAAIIAANAPDIKIEVR